MHVPWRRRVLWSVGSNNQLGFEEDAAHAFDAVYVFDCTLPNNTLAPKVPISPQLRRKLKFLPYCLKSADGARGELTGASAGSITAGQRRGEHQRGTELRGSGQRGGQHDHTSLREHRGGEQHERGRREPERAYLSYIELLTLTGEARGPELIKMDIEGWEWSVLHAMAAGASGWPQHTRPLQIAFELHLLDMLDERWLRSHRQTRAPGMPYCARREYFRQVRRVPLQQ